VAGRSDNVRSMWQYFRNPRFDLVWDVIRTPVAFLVAPLAAPVIVGVLGLAESPDFVFQSPDVLAVILAMTWSAACVITLLFGLPLFLILRRLRWTSFWIASVAGCLVPFVALIIILFSPALFAEPWPASAVVLVALCGAAVGSLLWLIARPDRNVAASSSPSN
jgi:hypothetical protein